jgi:hypothetical protein
VQQVTCKTTNGRRRLWGQGSRNKEINVEGAGVEIGNVARLAAMWRARPQQKPQRRRAENKRYRAYNRETGVGIPQPATQRTDMRLRPSRPNTRLKGASEEQCPSDNHRPQSCCFATGLDHTVHDKLYCVAIRPSVSWLPATTRLSTLSPQLACLKSTKSIRLPTPNSLCTVK